MESMNWDAIGAIGEIVGAAAVVLTLAYLAIQIRQAKRSTADQSRIFRANGVREMILEACSNDALRMGQTKNWGLEPYYEKMAEALATTLEDATRIDWGNAYYFWMWWGQYASSHEGKDRKELENVIESLCRTPGMRSSWENSPLIRPLLDKEFVSFVDKILSGPVNTPLSASGTSAA
jgi:hypothetical protein